MVVCQLCESEGPHTPFTAYEMMYGSRDAFEYIECSSCGSIQIVTEISDDRLASYYGSAYYSFSAESSDFVELCKAQRDRYDFRMMNIGGRLLSKLRPECSMSMIAALKLDKSSKILDVGCGSGKFLNRLNRCGFGQVSGLDPFIDGDFETSQGVPVRQGYLEDLSEKYDLIMFHHSLEHMPRLAEALEVTVGCLNSGGHCFVRIPTASSEAWETYGINWVQLDAPRHLVIPSRKGLEIAADRVGLRLTQVVDDSTIFQFAGSEYYKMGVPLIQQHNRHDFDGKAIAQFEARTRAVNAAGRGDQAAFMFARD